MHCTCELFSVCLISPTFDYLMKHEKSVITERSFHKVDIILIAMMLDVKFPLNELCRLDLHSLPQFCQTMLKFLFLTISLLRALRSLSVTKEEKSTQIFDQPEEFMM